MSSPYFMFYPAKYMADTPHFTTEQHGAYLLLLINYWQRGKALDNSDERLSHVVKMPLDKWLQIKDSLAEYFEVDGDSWTHGRMEFDLEMVKAKSIMASYAGRKSGEARRGTTVPEPIERPFDEKGTTVPETLNHKRMNEEMNERIKKERQILFDLFWNLYPKKQGKKEAQKAFINAIEKTPIELIMAGVTTYAKDPLRSPAYTKNAQGWLNGECWNDEPVEFKVVNPFNPKDTPTQLPPRFTAADIGHQEYDDLGVVR